MPFDSSTLQGLSGLTFDQDSWGGGSFGYHSTSGDTFTANSRPLKYISGQYAAGASLTITAVGGGYVPPEYANQGPGKYFAPTFGWVEVNVDIIKYGTAYNFGGRYYIYGFSEDGKSLLISNYPQLFIAGGNYDSLSGQPNKLILSSVPLSDQSYPLDFTAANQTLYTAPVCFAEGTLIETDRGPVAVEALVEGDMVVTSSGVARPVQWIGEMLVRPANRFRPEEAQPVRIEAGAFGEGLPRRDLRLSPGHSVYVDGVLIPVSNLINGATILQEEVAEVRYFHVELENHDVILAEGLPCETYLDDGNRTTFMNSDDYVTLHGRLDPKSWDQACAPMVAAGPQLEEVRNRLQTRATELGWALNEAADLRIVADGVEIAPTHADGNRYRFDVPAATSMTIASNAGVLAQVMPGLADHRQLGVAVSELRLDGVAIDLDDARFGSGFYAIENGEAAGWRWTDGAGTLDCATDAPAILELTINMVAPSWIRPTTVLRAAA